MTRQHKYPLLILWAILLLAPAAGAQTLPDNVDSAHCVFLPEGTEWVIDTPTISDNATSLILTTPMVGDIDDDGVPEIVVTAAMTSGYSSATHINIFRPDATLKDRFSIATGNYYYAIGMAKVQTEAGVYATIIVTFDNTNHFHAYLSDGTPLWTSDSTFRNHLTTSGNYKVPAISFLDINHDGWTEMLAGSEIYDAATGVLLCRDRTGNIGYAVRGSATDRIPYMTMAADLCGDSCLDLAVGNTVYNINLQSRTTFADNQMTVVHSVPDSLMLLGDNTAIPFRDGNTFLVDINLDGKLDVLVMNEDRDSGLFYLYIWDVGGDTIICSKRLPNIRKFGTPQIGDLDNDGYPEICFVAGTTEGVVSDYRDSIYALKYNPLATDGTMEVFWATTHSDRSGSTGLTMFDFNQDGLVELVYRDEWNLRIINGSLRHHVTGAAVAQPYDLASYPCGSSTVFEYPVIADVDKDGSAEIIVGGDVPLTTSSTGYIYIFKSGGVPWAPARMVWNQYLYHVTNVNKDLSIPLYQFDNATPFVDTLGVVRRPYNNLMQQATTIDQYGRPYYAVPDAAMDTMDESYGYDSITLTVDYCNQGENLLNAPYQVRFFNGQGGALVGVLTVDEDLDVDSCTHQQLTLPYNAVNGVHHLVAVVNAGNSGIAQNGGGQGECDTTNNILSNTKTYTVYDTIVCSDGLPLVWHDSLFSGADTKTIVLTAADGTESVTILRLRVHFTSSSTVYDTVVENDLPHYFNGQSFDGAVSDTLVIIPNAAGCDSNITYSLYVYNNIFLTFDSSVCHDILPLVWNGVLFDTVTDGEQVVVTRTLNMTTVNGADSVVQMNLTVNPLYNDTLQRWICEGEAYLFASNYYDTTGIYVNSMYSRYGCDSVEVLELWRNPVYDTTDTIIICPYHPYLYREVDYGGPTSFDTVLTTVDLCDSVVHVALLARDSNFRVRVFYSWDDGTLEEADSLLAGCAPAALYVVDSTRDATQWEWQLTTADTLVASDTMGIVCDFVEGSDAMQGVLSLIVTSDPGCRDTAEWPIYVFPRPTAAFSWEPHVASILHPDIQFINESQPERDSLEPDHSIAYLWRIPPVAGSEEDTTSEYEPAYHWGTEGDNMAGDYLVSLIVYWTHLSADLAFTHTCTDTVSDTVTITNEYLQFPNLVTPNGDGVNDTWEVVNFIEMGNYPMSELWIFDRTGALVYHVKNIHSAEQFWDPNKTRSPDGTYYYRFMAEGKYGLVKRNGLIEVLR